MTNKLTKLIQEDKKLNELYTVKREIGRGCFGSVYQAIEKRSGRQSVLKIEIATANEKNLTLQKEYRLMKQLQHIDGIPKVYNFSKQPRFNFIEIQRLHRNLEQAIQQNKDITPEEVCDIGWKVIQILRDVHNASIVHRDIKPQNIMFDTADKVYLIDFGISSLLNNKALKSKKIYRKIGYFIGTPRYASLAAHLGEQIMPKDDIQSLLYVLIFSTTKKLPWINAKPSKNKVQEIGHIKQKCNKKDLCRYLPKCYYSTFSYLESLSKDDPVDYARIIEYFKQQRVFSTLITMKTMPTDLSVQGKQEKTQNRCQSKKFSLNVPNESLYCDDCIRSDRVIVEFMTRYVFDEEDKQEIMSVQDQVKLGQPSLATKLRQLLPMHPKLKKNVDFKVSFKAQVRHVSWLEEQ